MLLFKYSVIMNLLFTISLLFTACFVLVSNGYPMKRIRTEDQREARISKRNVDSLIGTNRKIAHPFLRGVAELKPIKNEKLSIKMSDVVKSCKGQTGNARKACVTSLIRHTYPEYFNVEKTTPSPATTKKTPSACITETTTKPSNIGVISNQQSALLITSGKQKKISPVTQEDVTVLIGDSSLIQNENKLNCQAEEFGYEPETAKTIVALTAEVMCAFCKSEGDEECIARYCVSP